MRASGADGFQRSRANTVSNVTVTTKLSHKGIRLRFPLGDSSFGRKVCEGVLVPVGMFGVGVVDGSLPECCDTLVEQVGQASCFLC